jgi:hypothetical protein
MESQSIATIEAWIIAQGYTTEDWVIAQGYTTEDWVIAQGYITNVIASLGYTPANQTITINTTSPLSGGGDLSANRTIAISKSDATTDGYLSSSDWSTFNSKQNAITTGTISQYIRGDLSLGTFPTIPTVGTWGALDYPSWSSGTPFVKMTAAGTFALDTNTYLTSAVTSVGTTGLISGGPITTIGTITTSMNTNKLVGRSTAGTGIMEEITLGTGLSFSGTTLNASGASPLTTKGDLYTFNSTNARLPVGLNTQVLLADSSTSTGLKWGTNTAATPLGYYGAFQDVTNQTAAAINTGYPMKLGVTDLSNGVTVVSNSRVTIANTGIYNIQWSAQFTNPLSAENDVTIWLRKNGVDVPGSSGIVLVPAKHGSADGHTLPSWNFLLDVVAGDYYEFVWSTVNTSVYISFHPAGTPPPSTASVVLTVTQQSGIMAGTGITAINSLTGAAQTMVAGTSGTDFAVSSVGTTHTLNLPTASTSNRGALSTTDWDTFNGKQSALSGTGIVKSTAGTISYLTDNTTNWNTAYTNRITSLTTTGSSGASTLVSNILNIPTYTADGILPSQTSNSGKYLTTNGTTASWATVASGASLSGLTAAVATNTIANGTYLQTWNWANSGTSIGGLSINISDTTTTEGNTGIPTTAPLFVKRTGTITLGSYSYAASFINESTNNIPQRGVYFRAGAAGSTTAGASVVAENAIHIVKNSGVSNGLYFGSINDAAGDASIVRAYNGPQLLIKSPASGTIYLYPQSTYGTYIQSSTSEIINLGINTATKSALGFGADNGVGTTYRAQTTTAAVIERNSDALKLSANSGLSGGYAGFTPTFQLNIVGSTNNVGIGTTTPVTTAKLEIVSTTQGFLPPRMTTTQINAIASPAEGLIIYNTTLHVPCFWDGTGWRKCSHTNM